MKSHAYLVLISNADTGEMLEADIWGPHPPWNSSYQDPEVNVGVYLEGEGETFDEARKNLLWSLAYTGHFGNCRFSPITSKFRDELATEFARLIEVARKQYEEAMQPRALQPVQPIQREGGE